MSSNMFLQRTFNKPLTVEGVRQRGQSSDWCYAMHKVDWQGSFLAADGRTLICWFKAVDAESVRLALRKSGADTQFLWAGSVYEAPEPGVPNVAVERSFENATPFGDVEAVAKAARNCFQMHRVKYVRTFFSLDQKRMVCFYQAPDLESVRITQREAALPVDSIWGVQTIQPL